MVTTILLVLLSISTASSQFASNGLSFTITPNRISRCGDHVTQVMRFECHVTQSATEILDVEVGKKSVFGTNTPIARIRHDKQYTLEIVDNSLKSRLTQTNWASGRLSLSLDRPGSGDLNEYYCSAAYVAGPLRYSEETITVEAEDLKGQVPECEASNVMGSVTHHVSTTHAGAGRCPDGTADRSEALVLSYCRAPPVTGWQEGTKVLDICCQIPAYTPIATFVFGVYVEDEHGVSGVFLNCTDNGFNMALQLCGHVPMIVSLTRHGGGGFVEDPNNYHIVNYPQSHMGSVTPGVIG